MYGKSLFILQSTKLYTAWFYLGLTYMFKKLSKFLCIMYLCWFSSPAKHVAFLLLSRKPFVKCTCFFSVLSPKKVPQIPIFKILHCWLWYKNKGTQSSYKLHFMSLAKEKGLVYKKKGELLCLSEKWNRVAKKISPSKCKCRVCLFTARHLVSERNTSQQKSSIWKERKEKKKNYSFSTISNVQMFIWPPR